MARLAPRRTEARRFALPDTHTRCAVCTHEDQTAPDNASAAAASAMPVLTILALTHQLTGESPTLAAPLRRGKLQREARRCTLSAAWGRPHST
jgi:hypothetical protein